MSHDAYMALRLSPWLLGCAAMLGSALWLAAWWVMTGEGDCGPFPTEPTGGGSVFCGSPQERSTLGLPLFWVGATMWMLALLGFVLTVVETSRHSASER